MNDNNARSIQSLYLRLLNDKEWEPDDELRKDMVVALYAAMVGNPADLFKAEEAIC